MLTPFGIAIRKLRLDKGIRMVDLAAKIQRTSAFISAIETGRKPIPPAYVGLVARAMNLTPAEVAELQRAADQSVAAVKVDGLPGHQRELVAAFARRLDEIPQELLDEMKKSIFKSRAGDAPFKRRRGLLVPPASTKTLWEFAERIRSTFVGDNETEFPIMDVLEFRLETFFPGFYLDPCSAEELGDDEGRVFAGGNSIQLRVDVYDDAWTGHGRARFTAAHELGHFLLHRQIAMARVCEENQPIYRDAEWQADTFAGGLLMPARLAREFAGELDAAAGCGITPRAAGVMMAKYEKEGLL